MEEAARSRPPRLGSGRSPRPRALALLLGCLTPAAMAAAESELRLPPPAAFGTIPSVTYDAHGKRLGDARLDVVRLANGNVWMMASSGIPGAEAMVLSTEMRPVEGGRALQPLWQMSRSWDADGRALGMMFIDHEQGEAFCEHEQGDPRPPAELELPEPDRVAHVPLNLLFLPLARGETETVRFQFLLCALGPRVVDARADVKRELPAEDGAPSLVEVEYALDLNRMLEMIARPFLPRFSFWLAPGARDPWMGHRMPLASKGPEVLVLRTGVDPDRLEPAAE